MIRLLFVGDGPRDAATNPPIARTVTGGEFDAESMTWRDIRLHGEKGFDRKLLFILQMERSLRRAGVVATVDQDKSRGRHRLDSLRRARDLHRQKETPLPCAIGCADPHGEAWLLDDPVAVRTGLSLGTDIQVSNVTKVKSPKDALHELQRQSPRSRQEVIEVLGDIAKALDIRRCAHARETGLEDFVSDLRMEILPLFDAE